MRSGMKKSAFSTASILCRPENRASLDPKYKRMVEQIIRKPDDEEIPEERTPCPFCDFPTPVSEVECTNCKGKIPYCIASGYHIIKQDLCKCPNCGFNAIMSKLKTFIEKNGTCPMCSANIDISSITPYNFK